MHTKQDHSGVVAGWLLLLMEIALLAFTASRTYDLLQQLLPEGQGLFAIPGLAAVDFGVVGWSLYYSHRARGEKQRAIALLMIGFCLLAVATSTLVDLWLGAAGHGIVTSLPLQARIVTVFAIAGVIVINVVAFIISFLFDPEQRKRTLYEQADDAIFEETLRQIQEATPGVAARIAPQRAQEWVTRKLDQAFPVVKSIDIDRKEGATSDNVAGFLAPWSKERDEQEASQNGYHPADTTGDSVNHQRPRNR